MSKTKILVTGYGGFLGGAICRRLLATGYAVRGVARRHYPALADAGVEPIQGDLVDPQICRSAMEGCDAVIHTAALAGVWGPAGKYESANVDATHYLLDAAREYDSVRAFVFTSSPSVTFDGRPQSGIDESVEYPTRWLCHYPRTKALAEQAVLAANSEALPTCAIRPHLIWGEGDPHLIPRLIQKAKSGGLKRVGSGKNLIDTVHVEAAAEAHCQALGELLNNPMTRCCGKAYFLSDNEPIECWEWLSEILRLADVAVPDSSVSFGVAYRVGAILEWGFRVLGKKTEPPMTRFVASQLGVDHYFDISAAKRDFGYQPICNRSERFADMESWLKELARD
jgi:nucleoside-diphosphate-sugar epimerase